MSLKTFVFGQKQSKKNLYRRVFWKYAQNLQEDTSVPLQCYLNGTSRLCFPVNLLHIFVSFNKSITGGLRLFGLVLNIPTFKIHMWLNYYLLVVHSYSSNMAANKCCLSPSVGRNPRSNWFKTIDGIRLSFTKNIFQNLPVTFPLVTWFSDGVSGSDTGMVLSDVLKKLE